MSRKILVSLLFVISVTLGSFSMAQATFKDEVLISSEAKKAVNYMKDHRIMIGYNDLFSPQNVITRGEVAKILTVALGIVGPDEVLSKDVSTNFKDMKNHWATPYVEKLIAYNPSIINGYTDGTFQPDKPLRKDELVKLLVVAFQLKADSMPVYLKDHNNWAKHEIETVAKLGIEIGTNLYFNPDSNVNRESVALMVYRVLVPRERITADKNPAINKDIVVNESTDGKVYPDGWVAPVLKSQYTNDVKKNFEILEKELGFTKGGKVYGIPSYPQGAINVITSAPDSATELAITFYFWHSDSLKEAYRIPIVAKELFKFYFGNDATRVWNYFDVNSIPEHFTANGKKVNSYFSNATGGLTLEIMRK